MSNATQAHPETDLYTATNGGGRLFKLDGIDGFGIELGGKVCILPLAKWHALAWDAPRTEEREVLGHYPEEAKDGRRWWWTGGTWLYPGDVVAFAMGLNAIQKERDACAALVEEMMNRGDDYGDESKGRYLAEAIRSRSDGRTKA